MTAWKIFWTITVVHWCKTLENLISISKSPLSHRGTEEALWLQSMWLWDNMNIWDLISHSWLSLDHVLQRHTQKKSLIFPCISYIFFPFIHFKSHCQTPGSKQFQSHLLPKCNWCSQKKKKRQQSFLQGRPHSSYSLMRCKPRLGAHRHKPSCAWIHQWLWKSIYPVAMSSTA